MSSKTEDFMQRCVQSAIYSARARDPMVAKFYKRMAIRWFRRAVEERGKIRPEQIGHPLQIKATAGLERRHNLHQRPSARAGN
jgi:hypothetical protein